MTPVLVLPQFHADELRFVENGCHDNPTLDVASDGQHEMGKKKQPDSNGLSGEGASREEASRWQVAGTTAQPGSSSRSLLLTQILISSCS